LGIFIQRLNPRAKALGPNQTKNAQFQLVKLSKLKVFVKLKNVSDKKRIVILLANVKMARISLLPNNLLFPLKKRFRIRTGRRRVEQEEEEERTFSV
jgi:hypothetical protein